METRRGEGSALPLSLERKRGREMAARKQKQTGGVNGRRGSQGMAGAEGGKDDKLFALF